ncbi:MAG: hypothetical protein ACI36Z_00430 [Alloprevotella sp.]
MMQIMSAIEKQWTLIASLFTYTSAAQAPYASAVLKDNIRYKDVLEESLTKNEHSKYVSLKTLMDKLCVHESRAIRLDGNLFFVEGFLIEKEGECFIIIEDIAGTHDERLLPAPEFGKDCLKLGKSNIDHLTLMALSRMAFSVILRLTGYDE